MDDDLPELLTTREAANALRISVRSLERLNEDGRGPPRVTLTPRRFGYPKRGVAAWLDARTTPSKHAA